MTDYEEKLIKSPEPSLEQLMDGTEFMVCMTEANTGSDWLKKISEFEDFLGIGDEASKSVQEQKAKARILQSVLAAEDAEEAERKVEKMIKHGESEKEATSEEEGSADPDEVSLSKGGTCHRSSGMDWTKDETWLLKAMEERHLRNRYALGTGQE
ncbi:hypothetical protein JCGZ_13559 [Jatropha curcas]|uniref:Uncharacterized protein n=1 Tax=Jatropha curcas TaxID=180498 RepID=A0A067KN85_JATCU|nr:hypothetical protein JCGZ_13559 [Jatropha curcas]